MVKKLFKHEIFAYLRTIIPMHFILIGIALLSRIIQLFDNNSTTYNIIFGSSIFFFVVAVIVCMVLTTIYGIKRFYSNLFSHEGYLSFTLPVTSTQHIIVKNVVALIAQVSSIVMIFIATCIITFGDVCVEAFKALFYILGKSYDYVGFDFVLYLFEFILLMLVSVMSGYMLFYACISLGQRAKKNRVAAAVGCFFGYYFIIQLLSTISTVFINIFYDYLPIEAIEKFIENNTQMSIHIILCALIIWEAIEFVIYFAIAKHSISKKLNLE